MPTCRRGRAAAGSALREQVQATRLDYAPRIPYLRMRASRGRIGRSNAAFVRMFGQSASDVRRHAVAEVGDPRFVARPLE